ncbi:hypothetical protein ABID59_000764 [Bradyrhizobium sp. S3.3.6]|uniref:Rv2993c-like domain-containing protein n=1 Tax=unclassified Bradyrhizobium TaxID=2631580 RepID=UPI00339167FB
MRWVKFTASGKTSWGLIEGDPLSEWQWTSRTRSALARCAIGLCGRSGRSAYGA